MLLKFAVGAKLPAVAGVIIALSGHHFVEASFPAVVGNVVVLDAGVILWFGPAEARLHLVIFGHFSLAVEVEVLLEGGEVFETVPQVVQSLLVVLDEADHLR